VAAADLLWAEGLDFSLLIVGTGPLEGQLRAWADRKPQGRVALPGSVAHDAVPAHLNAMDLLVVPSRTTRGWKEQFGRVVIEALACGVPVAGSDSGHIPALLSETGGGVVFAERDPRAMAAALRPLMARPESARALGEAGRQAVLQSYAVTPVAERLYAAVVSLTD